MPTDAGIVTRAEAEAYTDAATISRREVMELTATIEQFAEALRGECSCYDYVYATRGTDETRAAIGIRIEVCGWCKHRKELLAAYDGAPANDNRKDG